MVPLALWCISAIYLHPVPYVNGTCAIGIASCHDGTHDVPCVQGSSCKIYILHFTCEFTVKCKMIWSFYCKITNYRVRVHSFTFYIVHVVLQ